MLCSVTCPLEFANARKFCSRSNYGCAYLSVELAQSYTDVIPSKSPESRKYFLFNFALRKYRYHRYIGIADILGQKYRYRVTFQIPISRPCPLEQNSGDVTGFVETLQYWFWNNGLLLNSSKSVIVYFGTHGRLRQSYHHSHRS